MKITTKGKAPSGDLVAMFMTNKKEIELLSGIVNKASLTFPYSPETATSYNRLKNIRKTLSKSLENWESLPYKGKIMQEPITGVDIKAYNYQIEEMNKIIILLLKELGNKVKLDGRDFNEFDSNKYQVTTTCHYDDVGNLGVYELNLVEKK